MTLAEKNGVPSCDPLIACNYRVLSELLDPLVLGGKMERGGRQVLLDIQDPVDLLETKEI